MYTCKCVYVKMVVNVITKIFQLLLFQWWINKQWINIAVEVFIYMQRLGNLSVHPETNLEKLNKSDSDTEKEKRKKKSSIFNIFTGSVWQSNMLAVTKFHLIKAPDLSVEFVFLFIKSHLYKSEWNKAQGACAESRHKGVN